MTIVTRRVVLFALAIVVSVFCTLLLPLRAEAAGSTVTLNHDRAQVGDPISVLPDDSCLTLPLSLGYKVVAHFTDSTGTTIGGEQIVVSVPPTYMYDAGWWGPGIFQIPEGASLGVATVAFSCMASVGGGGYMTTVSYDPVAVTVVGQSADITVDRTHLWSTAKFESIVPCPTPGSVEVKIVSQETQQGNGIANSYTYVTDEVFTDSSGAWEYSVDLSPGNGFQEYDEYFDPTVAVPENKLYSLRVRCVGSSESYEYDSFMFEVLKDEYVALGDSFSAGTGSFNYDLNGCFRSTDSYAYYLVDELGLGLPNFGACHGAVTDDFFQYVDGPPQTWRLTNDTKYVTLTIGGNDIGFSAVIKQCADHYGNQGYACMQNSTLTGPLEDRLAALADPNETAYTPAPDDNPSATYEIHTIKETLQAVVNAAPNAEIYIAGYPYLFGDSNSNYVYDGDAPGAHKCVVRDGAVLDLAVSYWDALWMNDKADELNSVISDAVEDLQGDGEAVTYVAPTTFNGHGLCDSGVSYINAIDLNGTQGTPESMHPTIDGYRYGYGLAFEAEMN